MEFKIRSAVFPIIIITAIVFFLQFFLGNDFTIKYILISHDIFSRPWILLTSIFLHGSPMHLLFNMYALAIFGPLLEQKIGPARFLFIYLFSGIFAAFFSSFFYNSALGASGAIMGMLGVLIILMPDLPLLLFFVIPAPLWLAGIIFAAVDILGVLFPSNVGNLAHLAGLGVGLGYGLLLRKQKKRFHRKFESKKHLEKEDLEEYLKTGKI